MIKDNRVVESVTSSSLVSLFFFTTFHSMIDRFPAHARCLVEFWFVYDMIGW